MDFFNIREALTPLENEIADHFRRFYEHYNLEKAVIDQQLAECFNRIENQVSTSCTYQEPQPRASNLGVTGDELVAIHNAEDPYDGEMFSQGFHPWEPQNGMGDLSMLPTSTDADAQSLGSAPQFSAEEAPFGACSTSIFLISSCEENRQDRTGHRVRTVKQNHQKNRVTSIVKARKKPKRALMGGITDEKLISACEAIPGFKDLQFHLEFEKDRHINVLLAMYTHIARLEGFEQFKGALAYIQSSERSPLPRDTCQFALLVDAVEKMQHAHFALLMCRGIGLIRINQRRAQIERRMKKTSPMVGSTPRSKKNGRIPSDSLDKLAADAQKSSNTEEYEKLRKRIQNLLQFSKFWCKMRNNFGPGILALLPMISHCALERIVEASTDTFIAVLDEKHGVRFRDIAMVLSKHLIPILEGDDCQLADAVVRGSIKGWLDVLSVADHLPRCNHTSPSR